MLNLSVLSCPFLHSNEEQRHWRGFGLKFLLNNKQAKETHIGRMSQQTKKHSLKAVCRLIHNYTIHDFMADK